MTDLDRTTDPGLTRRSLVKGALGSLVLGFTLSEGTGVTDVLGRAGRAGAATPAATGPSTAVNTWLTVGADDTITLTVGSSEMGQGSFSGLAQVLCEDLCVAYDRVRVVQGGPTMLTPAPIGTSINTVGSSVTRSNYWKLRDAGAIAREVLVQAAMNAHGDTTRANWSVADGVITHTSGARFTYGQVAPAAALLTPPASAPLVPDNELKVIGKTVARKDIPSKVNGSAIFGLDVRLPGMLYAIIKHSPALGGTLKAIPKAPTGMKVVPTKVWAGTGRGLEAVGNVNAVAVVGPNTWDTWRAAKSLSVSWNPPPNAANLNSTKFATDANALLTGGTPYVAGGTNGPGTVYTVEGSAAVAGTAIAGAAKVVEAVYTLPYVAHAAFEVLNCTVDYVAGVKCDIYAPTQGSKAVLTLAAAITGLPTSAIKVNTTLLGGGLGRKWESDFISQAIQVGMAVGKPVKLMWPREEDFKHDQYRPMAAIKARAGLDATNKVVGWSYRNVSPSLLAQRGTVLGATGDSQGIEAGAHLPYDLGSISTEYVTHPSPIPIGFWRSVGASLNTFGVECFIDELALAAGEDPYDFRMKRLLDDRWKNVLQRAATLGGWTTPLPSGRARGIAIGTAFNSIVAEVVEISSVTTTSIKIEKVAVVIDAYLTVNPGQVEHQIVGGVVHGINATLYGKQTFVGGAAQSGNFNTNRMIRPSEMPKVSVEIIANPAAPSRTTPIGGVGELGVPTLAPALANAHFRKTRTRVRALPFFPTATMGGL